MNVPQFVHEYLQSIAIELGFLSSLNISFDVGSSIGDGNLGDLVAATITGEGQNPVHLVCKLMVENAETRESMKLAQLFKREVFFYEKVVPAFENFQRTKAIDGFVAYPKCYGCVIDEDMDTYLIVMEDLRSHQYRMWPKKDPVDVDHARAVICELAKFHAVSFAMKDQQPDIFNELNNIEDLLKELLQQNSFISYLKESHDQISAVLEKYLPQHVGKLRCIWEETMPIVNRILDGKTFEPFVVLLHGDLWNNNTLFQYEKTHDRRKPSSVSFVDWQFLNYNSPALDLMFYIFSATDKKLRDDHYMAFIQLYHSTLADSVKMLGSDPEQVCPYHKLTEHLKIFGTMTYLTFPSAIDVIFEDDKKELRLICEDKETCQTDYEQRVVGFALDLMKLGYI